MKQKEKEQQNEKRAVPDEVTVTHEHFDRNMVQVNSFLILNIYWSLLLTFSIQGMGKDGLDNLQTVKLNDMSPLPQPRSESVTKSEENKNSTMSRRDPSARYSDICLQGEEN